MLPLSASYSIHGTVAPRLPGTGVGIGGLVGPGVAVGPVVRVGVAVALSPTGSLGAYLDSLGRLRELDLEVLCPGHGPYVWDPRAKIDEYIEHKSVVIRTGAQAPSWVGGVGEK